ncbi:3-oxoacyl-[acyl-carrier-protein] reductase [Gelria sp. Kuro-4]|uniref:3-oxoacyl-[acyl-carrier-protein] reductase n=1 Tax=Gelria sp. Kuro-4 TaxID=2796927 RepID=UPI001BF17CA8|nr:3-oxoacyl-[acyl-carrier-protein] reductase [Gelria sp. Kuro-4]BCV24787.1 beta-ketoacyl-ACP reductase [Gelria sp. Kuro-4]
MVLIPGAAVVTGGSRGIGRAIALELARLGAPVAVNYAGRAEAAREVVELITAAGGRAVAVQADVAQAAEAGRLLAEAEAALGPVGILVNNAGITRDGLLLRMKEEDWDAVLNTNLSGVFHCTQAALRGMLKRRRGRIVNTASIVGLTGNAGQANYAAAKAGIIGFTKSVAREVAGRGITVNAVAPGFIATEMTTKLPAEVREAYRSRIPLGRFGEPEDVARAVAFLASEAAAYITGQVLAVDGGLAM